MPLRALQQSVALRSTITRSRVCFMSTDAHKEDPRTKKPLDKAEDTENATHRAVHASKEGDVKQALKEVGDMAKNAAIGAKETAKLMYDSVKKNTAGRSADENVQENLRPHSRNSKS